MHPAMTSSRSFPHAASLARLQADPPLGLPTGVQARLHDPDHLASLREALSAAQRLHSSREQIGQVADLLRRDQKFVRPGPPSPHLVRLRQQQAAARQAGNQAQQAWVRSATALVRCWQLSPPAGQAVETFVAQWLARSLPPEGAGD